MKLVFVSNYFNHHQQPVSDRFYALCQKNGGSYTFVQTEQMEEERLKMGWGDVFQQTSYLKNYWEDPEEIQKLIDEADAVIYGGTDEECYIQNRLKAGKLIIRYSERLYKTGRWKFVSPRGLKKKFIDHTRYGFKKVYLLCSGAYVAGDFRLVLAYPFKKFKYGYFPIHKEYNIEELMTSKESVQRGVVEMMWAARMIDWKHPEVPIRLASMLKKKGYDFHLTMVGGGVLETEVHQLAEKLDVLDKISFTGNQNPESVRALMEKADIYLTTSDYQEGWGAVINEAMNSGCAIVANRGMGAAPYMIQHGVNGCLYHNGKIMEAFECIENLLKDADKRQAMGKAAYDTVLKEWNSEVAANRTYQMIEELLEGCKKTCYKSGPLSKA